MNKYRIEYFGDYDMWKGREYIFSASEDDARKYAEDSILEFPKAKYFNIMLVKSFGRL